MKMKPEKLIEKMSNDELIKLKECINIEISNRIKRLEEEQRKSQGQGVGQ